MASNVPRAVVREIGTLWVGGIHAGLTDRQLLDRFTARRDETSEAAFAALVSRHGAMVWGVCRRVLLDPEDARDAFQATFLILVRKARLVRTDDSLGPWLHGVGLRVALKARGASQRRRFRERTNTALPESAVLDAEPVGDLLRVIDEELDRIPARYQSAVMLCHLEGLTHEEAAARLRCPVGTVRSRLARGREILRRRLARRGLAPEGAALVPGWEGSAPVDALSKATARAATELAAGKTLAGVVPAGVVALLVGVERMMTLKKLGLTASIVTVFLVGIPVVVALAGPGRVGEQPAEAAPSVSVEQDEANPAPAGKDFDNFPAFVVKSVPETGSTDVDPGLTEIKVVYSKNMNNGSWSWSQLGKETFPQIDPAKKLHYEKDRRTAVLPVKLEPGKTYAIFCNSPKFHNFKDFEGNPAVPYMLVFRTKK